MDIRLSPRALKYLRDKNVSEITFYLVDIETTGSIGAVREVGVSLAPPGRPENFRYERAGGFEIYIDSRLEVTEPIVIKKQGFWKFSSLYADGLGVRM
ncbi:MAG: hypothetical protein K9J85_08365 [Desulfobacteraceae bacterium]|nr:hypothetical protein [Desulfobacteraceae bacterium]